MHMSTQDCLVCMSREPDIALAAKFTCRWFFAAQYRYASLLDAELVIRYSHGNVQDLQMLPQSQSCCMQVLIGSKVCANAGCCSLCGAPALQ